MKSGMKPSNILFVNVSFSKIICPSAMPSAYASAIIPIAFLLSVSAAPFPRSTDHAFGRMGGDGERRFAIRKKYGVPPCWFVAYLSSTRSVISACKSFCKHGFVPPDNKKKTLPYGQKKEGCFLCY